MKAKFWFMIVTAMLTANAASAGEIQISNEDVVVNHDTVTLAGNSVLSVSLTCRKNWGGTRTAVAGVLVMYLDSKEGQVKTRHDSVTCKVDGPVDGRNATNTGGPVRLSVAAVCDADPNKNALRAWVMVDHAATSNWQNLEDKIKKTINDSVEKFTGGKVVAPLGPRSYLRDLAPPTGGLELKCGT